MAEPTTMSPWRRFWERGGWWRALLFAVVYYAVYQGGSLLFTPLVSSIGDSNSASYVFVLYVLPIALAGILLVVFALTVGWLRELFGRQPIRGRGWMWIAVAVVLVFNVLHFASIDYGSIGFDYVATWLLAGLAIGFAEEVVTRGFVVNLMRKAGHREITVALVSAAIFAGLHAGNLFTGQALGPTVFQLVYTFFFGICMYLALRVTGTLIAPILLHASTDPSIFLSATHPADGALSAIGGFGNFAVIATGLVLVFFIRGRVAEPSAGFETASGIPRS